MEEQRAGSSGERPPALGSEGHQVCLPEGHSQPRVAQVGLCTPFSCSPQVLDAPMATPSGSPRERQPMQVQPQHWSQGQTATFSIAIEQMPPLP